MKLATRAGGRRAQPLSFAVKRLYKSTDGCPKYISQNRQIVAISSQLIVRESREGLVSRALFEAEGPLVRKYDLRHVYMGSIDPVLDIAVPLTDRCDIPPEYFPHENPLEILREEQFRVMA